VFLVAELSIRLDLPPNHMCECKGIRDTARKVSSTKSCVRNEEAARYVLKSVMQQHLSTAYCRAISFSINFTVVTRVALGTHKIKAFIKLSSLNSLMDFM
jgi:hypothetical protein